METNHCMVPFMNKVTVHGPPVFNRKESQSGIEPTTHVLLHTSVTLFRRAKASHCTNTLFIVEEQGHKHTVSMNHNIRREQESRSGIEPTSLCLPAGRLSAGPNRLTTQRVKNVVFLIGHEKQKPQCGNLNEKLPFESNKQTGILQVNVERGNPDLFCCMHCMGSCEDADRS